MEASRSSPTRTAWGSSSPPPRDERRPAPGGVMWRIPSARAYNDAVGRWRFIIARAGGGRLRAATSRWMTGPRRAVALLLGLAVCVGFPPTVAGADRTADEIALGAQAAKEIESQYRVVTDPAMVERLTRVGGVVARVVDRQELTYRFKILDIPGVNALGVPGGWVYVTKGMMRFVRTDDELA